MGKSHNGGFGGIGGGGIISIHQYINVWWMPVFMLLPS